MEACLILNEGSTKEKKSAPLFCLQKKKIHAFSGGGTCSSYHASLDWTLKEEECLVLRIVMDLVSDGCIAAYP